MRSRSKEKEKDREYVEQNDSKKRGKVLKGKKRGGKRYRFLEMEMSLVHYLLIQEVNESLDHAVISLVWIFLLLLLYII